MRRRLFVLAVVAVFLGCNGDSSTAPDPAVGTYNLRTVNGSPLPAVISTDEPVRIEMISGFVRLESDLTFEASATARVSTGPLSATQTENVSGTWSRDGNVVTFVPSDGTGSYQGTLSGNDLTAVDQGITLVFTRSG